MFGLAYPRYYLNYNQAKLKSITLLKYPTL